MSTKALYISSAVPSKNFPQPATNRVSPEHNQKIECNSVDAVTQHDVSRKLGYSFHIK